MQKERAYRVLIVDDDAEDRNLISRALSREDFICETANDGIMAENMLKRKDYEVVISDLRMPRKHGHQLIAELLERPNPPLVIAVTGLVEPKLVTDLLERGVAEVIQKPLRYSVLGATVKSLLHRKKYGEQSAQYPETSGAVAKTIRNTTDNLRSQLKEVTGTFQQTIDRLEAQKQQIEGGLIDSLRILGNLISLSGSRQQSHVGRVELLAENMGEELGLDAEHLYALKYAALLHEIGQFGMPDNVRNKPQWALEGEDLDHFQTYPIVGAALLSEVRGGEMAAEIIEAHCENYDGTGFPKGLRGREIPLAARILRLADGCDSIRMFLTQEDVVEVLREHARSEEGKAYDPALVKLALALLPRMYQPERVEDIREIELSEAVPGMVLAENLYDRHGQFLARRGAKISQLMLTRLRHLLHGQKVYVRSEES